MVFSYRSPAIKGVEMEISRRSFVGFLGAVPFLGFAPKLDKVSGRKIMMNRFSIAGFQYYSGPKILRKIKKGDRLTLVAEPKNPYDEFAVEIYFGKTKLGYVPRSDNRHISRLLGQGAEVLADVEYTRLDGPSWKAVKTNVYLMQS